MVKCTRKPRTLQFSGASHNKVINITGSLVMTKFEYATSRSSYIGRKLRCNGWLRSVTWPLESLACRPRQQPISGNTLGKANKLTI